MDEKAAIAEDIDVVLPGLWRFGALYQRHMLDDSRVRRAYTDDLPETVEMLARLGTDRPGVILLYRGQFSGMWWFHDAQEFAHVSKRSGWTCGFVAEEFRGEEWYDFQIVQMETVVEIFFERACGCSHLYAAVIAANPGGNAWAMRLGFTFAGLYPELFKQYGIRIDHNIYAWRKEQAPLALQDAKRRSYLVD